MAKPMPGADIPVINPTGQMNQVWFEFIQSLLALLNSTASTLAGLPAHDAAKSNVTRTINAQAGTSYTFAITDAGNLCEFTNAAAVTVTVPPNATIAFPVGTQIDLMAGGAGKVTFAQGAGVTVKSVNSFKSLAAQEAAGTLVKMATDTWRLTGSLVA